MVRAINPYGGGYVVEQVVFEKKSQIMLQISLISVIMRLL